ncbi:hypothetical protein LAT59_00435 [Candidatus Gracilibacteria bacterium]|nr:hypothetical protein [Candidatus Gracilibacteria bacterium]
MIMVYIRMLLAFTALFIAYTALIVYIPSVGQSIDEFTGKTWNADLSERVEIFFGKAREAQDTLEQKLDNPAPNTSRNIEGRTGR